MKGLASEILLISLHVVGLFFPANQRPRLTIQKEKPTNFCGPLAILHKYVGYFYIIIQSYYFDYGILIKLHMFSLRDLHSWIFCLNSSQRGWKIWSHGRKYQWIKIRTKLKKNNTSHNRCRHAQGNLEIIPFQQKWTRYMSYHTSCRFLDSLFAFCLGAFDNIRGFCTNCTKAFGLYSTELPTEK